MKVTCPKGHEIEISDPVEVEGVVGITTNGTELIGVIEHDVVTVVCGYPTGDKTLCGASFEVSVN